MLRNLVLIPSSRFVEADLQLEVGQIPPALIPVNNRPLLFSIVERYTKLTGQTDFVVVGHQGYEQLQDAVQRYDLDQEINLVRVPNLPDLGATLSNALGQLNLCIYDRIYINFGDTLIDADIEHSSDTVYYQDLTESYRWTGFEIRKGQLGNITDKFLTDSTCSQHTFVGVFLIQDPQQFAQCLRRCTATPKLGRFYASLQKYLETKAVKFINVESWHDFGHVDNYHDAKRNFINTRYFNQIEVDQKRAVLTKTSQRVDKLMGEIKWYLELPATLRCYAPQVFDYSLNRADAFVKLEYYGYPSVQELYTFGARSLGIWNHVFNSTFSALAEMQRYKLEEEQDVINEIMYQMLIRKTYKRLEALSGQPALSPFFDQAIYINGRQYPSLCEYTAKLDYLFEEYVLNQVQQLSVVHGDLCISNILFDPRTRIVKFVDPRGSFGPHTLYGSMYYDLAKLSHSFNGKYEHIISDSFSCTVDYTSIQYELYVSEYQHKVTELFNERLGAQAGPKLDIINFIEATHFLSMASLHAERPDRQILMLVRAVEQMEALLQHCAPPTQRLEHRT